MTTLYKHPTYVENYLQWKTLYDCYHAERSVITSGDYLWFHRQEKVDGTSGAELRRGREQRTRYLNLPELIVSLWISFFFRDKPKLDKKVTQLFDPYGGCDNIDGRGTSLESFMKSVLESYLIYGKSVILVDAMPMEFASRKEEVEKGYRAYMSLIPVLSATDWNINNEDQERVGQFDYLRYNYNQIPPRKRAADKPQIVEMSDELFFDGTYYSIQRYRKQIQENPVSKIEAKKQKQDPSSQFADGDWIEQGAPLVTKMTRVPVVQIESESWLKDVNEESLRFYNLRSVKDSILLHQAYQKLFVTGVDISNATERKALTEALIALLPNKDCNVISIDPVDTSSLETAEAQSLSYVFKVALNQLRSLPSDSRASQAADSQAEEKDNMSALVESTLTEVENAMNQAVELFAENVGQEGFKGKIELNKEITDEDLQQFMDMWGEFGNDLKQYPEITAEVLKKAVDKLNLPEDKVDKFKKQIDKNPPQAPQLMTSEEEQFDEDGNPLDKVSTIKNKTSKGRAKKAQAKNKSAGDSEAQESINQAA